MSQTSPYLERQKRLVAALQAADVDALVLNPGPSLVYLTGLHFHLMERPVVAFFSSSAPVTLALPALEAGKMSSLPYPAQAIPYGEDPQIWGEAFHQAARAAGTIGKRVCVEPLRLRVLELRLLEATAPGTEFISAETVLADLRISKDAGEISAMRKAVEIAQEALLATLPAIKAGVTERQIASELVLQLLRHGSESEMPFSPIVSGGPNSANPHATPTDRPLQPGDLLVIDWGAASDGYISDLTRTFAIGAVDRELEMIAQTVKAANEAGRMASRPGVTAESIDAAARQVIDEAGYGQYFIHRTGHGIGMEGHEAPYIRSGNTLILSPGMTYTVEPGIYLPGRGGVRIEDNMVITEQGAETLSDLPRDLIILDA